MARLLRSRSIFASTVAGLVLVLAAGIATGSAAPRPDLPPVAADELIASSLGMIAARTPISGTVRTHVDLGLPQLPGALADPAGPAQVFLSDQTFKMWRSPDGVRVAQLLPFAERDLVQNATDAWAWDSEKFTAWHVGVLGGATPPPVPSVGDLVGMAGNAIDALKPYATVSLAEPTVVAGRDAYVVSMTPISGPTLVGHVDVAIDAETRLPLRLQIFPKGRDAPAVEGGFVSVDFGSIDPSMFDFTPPEGATVKELTPPNEPPGGCPPGCGGGAGMPEVRVFGEGFGLVVAVRIADVPKQYAALLPYSGPLGSMSLVERGGSTWLLAGAVGSEALDAAAQRLP
jgi:hypothetical protein